MNRKLLPWLLCLSLFLNLLLGYQLLGRNASADDDARPLSALNVHQDPATKGREVSDQSARVSTWRAIADDLDFLFQRGDIELAVNSALAEITAYPRQVNRLLDGWMEQADAWIISDARKDWEKTFVFLETVAPERYQSPSFRMLQSDSLFRKGDYTNAIDGYYELINTSRGPEQRIFLDRLQLRLTTFFNRVNADKNWQLGNAVIERLLWHRPGSGEYLLMSGLLNIELSRYDTARANLLQAETIEDFSFRARELLQRIDLLDQQSSAIALKAVGESQFLARGLLGTSTEVALLVDTGASLSVLEKSTFERIAGRLQPTFVENGVFNTAGGEVSAPIYRFRRFALGPYVVSDIEFAVMDFSTAPENNGLLGMNFLSNFDFQIDQDSALLLLGPRK